MFARKWPRAHECLPVTLPSSTYEHRGFIVLVVNVSVGDLRV